MLSINMWRLSSFFTSTKLKCPEPATVSRGCSLYRPGDSGIGPWVINLVVEVSQSHMISEIVVLVVAERCHTP